MRVAEMRWLKWLPFMHSMGKLFSKQHHTPTDKISSTWNMLNISKHHFFDIKFRFRFMLVPTTVIFSEIFGAKTAMNTCQYQAAFPTFIGFFASAVGGKWRALQCLVLRDLVR